MLFREKRPTPGFTNKKKFVPGANQGHGVVREACPVIFVVGGGVDLGLKRVRYEGFWGDPEKFNWVVEVLAREKNVWLGKNN